MLANRFQRLLVNLTIPVECFYLTPSHIVDECRAPSIKERDPLAGLLITNYDCDGLDDQKHHSFQIPC